jgi:hypothetical protein
VVVVLVFAAVVVVVAAVVVAVAAAVVSAVVLLVVLVAFVESCLSIVWCCLIVQQQQKHCVLFLRGVLNTNVVFQSGKLPCCSKGCNLCKTFALSKTESAEVISHYFIALTSRPPQKRCKGVKNTRKHCSGNSAILK